MTTQAFKHVTASGLFAVASLLCLPGLVQARDGLSWSVGVSAPGATVHVSNAPAVVLPAPVVVGAMVPVRPMYVASAPVVAQPVYLVQERKVHKGKGWHKKHGHQVAGRGHYWSYDAMGAQGAAVVVQAAPHVWVR